MALELDVFKTPFMVLSEANFMPLWQYTVLPSNLLAVTTLTSRKKTSHLVISQQYQIYNIRYGISRMFQCNSHMPSNRVSVTMVRDIPHLYTGTNTRPQWAASA